MPGISWAAPAWRPDTCLTWSMKKPTRSVPDNPLILMTGLLNGTSGPSVSRWGGATKSPYTGHYGDSNAGAWFGAELKNAGYDGIILKGRAIKPVYLYIKDGQAELRDAADLWGKDTAETQEEIKKDCGDEAHTNCLYRSCL